MRESELEGHSTQEELPRLDLNVPEGQGVHVPPLAPEWPWLQRQAVPALLPAGESECVEQLSQLAFPPPVLYRDLPIAHSVHIPPSRPVEPALHVQAVTAVLCAGELESAGQSTHAAAPVYLPTTHWVHAPPSAPEDPALHAQAVAAMLRTGEMVLDGQRSHDAGPALDL